jgi:hypothetical protein
MSWTGIWLPGTDNSDFHYGLNSDDFQNKCNELYSQNLLLVDIEAYVENGQTLWAGVWREGDVQLLANGKQEPQRLVLDADWAAFTGN